jgi:hypothetical protein
MCAVHWHLFVTFVSFYSSPTRPLSLFPPFPPVQFTPKNLLAQPAQFCHTSSWMSHQPDNIFAGTQVVALVEIRGPNKSLVHPRGAVPVETHRDRLSISLHFGGHWRRASEADHSVELRTI